MISLDMEGLDRNLIEKLSLDNPIIRMALMYHLKGHLTWEQSLIAMVSWLSQCNAELTKTQEEHLSRSAPSLVFQLSNEQLSGFLDIVKSQFVK